MADTEFVTTAASEVTLETPSSNDFVVPCSSESLHLFHSLSPKKRLQFHCYELLLLQVTNLLQKRFTFLPSKTLQADDTHNSTPS